MLFDGLCKLGGLEEALDLFPQNGEGFASRLFCIMFSLVNSAKWGTWGKLSCMFMETNKKGFFLDAVLYDIDSKLGQTEIANGLLIDTEKKGLEQTVAGLARLENAPKAYALAKEMHNKIVKLGHCMFSEEMQRKV